MTTLIRINYQLLFLLTLVFHTTIVLSETSAIAADSGTVTLENINTERSIVTNSQSFSDQQRNELLAKLDETAKLLQESKQLGVANTAIQSEIDQASSLIKQIEKKSLDQYAIKDSVFANYNTDKLTSLLDTTRNELELGRTSLEQQEKLLAEYVLFAKNGGAEIADINERINRSRLNHDGENKNSVNSLFSATKLQQLTSRLAFIKTKQKNLNTLTGLATARRDFYAKEVILLQKNIDQIHTVLQAKASSELKSSQIDAEKTTPDLPPELKPIQDKINILVQEQNELLADSSIKSRRLDTLKRLLDELQADQTRVQQVIQLAGDSEQISTLLQKKRALIPSVSSLTEEVISYQTTMSEAVLRQLYLDEMLRENRSENALVDQLKTPGQHPELTSKVIKKIVENHRNIIQDLLKTYNTYIAQLSTLDAITRQLLSVALDYRNYIDERLLWMPSTGLISLFEFENLLHGMVWFISPGNIEQLVKDAVQSIKSHKSKVFIFISVVLSLLIFRRRALSSQENCATKTRKISTDSISSTLIALISTLVLTLPLPVLLIGSGLILATSARANEFTVGIAAGLQGSGMLLLILLFMKELCRKNGLAIFHLRWQETLCEMLNKQLNLIMPFVIPLSFLYSINASGISSAFVYLSSYKKISEPGIYTLGQIAFIALMTIVLHSIYRIWHKDSVLMQKLAVTSSKANWSNYHTLWYLPLLMLPLGFTLASILGYDYTVTFLIAKTAQTIWFILGLILLKDILLRSLYVTQRRMKLEEALKARQELKKLREESDATSDSATEHQTLDEEKILYGDLSSQVDKLLRTIFITAMLIGLWWVWKGVIPALNIFNSVDLPMTTSIIVDGVSKEIPLTLGDLLIGLILGGLTLLAAKSVPGILEFTLLNRLPIEQASRYAVTTLTQYFVAVIGVTISFNALGLQWSNIQWLVAALSVGLGFGLQEIVANFVSGIILLFEQPIRVGDVVTVDGTTGTVSRIRIRATTIVNWEKQELIVPNKTFITGQLVNWTLSDTVNRVIISVGVAYGSDTVKAMQLIREAAEEQTDILLEPAPRITFEEFGDNSLNLKLRVYLNDIDLRLPTITALHQSITDKFKDAGIVIAYPQRDLHLDTTTPLEMILVEPGKRS